MECTQQTKRRLSLLLFPSPIRCMYAGDALPTSKCKPRVCAVVSKQFPLTESASSLYLMRKRGGRDGGRSEWSGSAAVHERRVAAIYAASTLQTIARAARGGGAAISMSYPRVVMRVCGTSLRVHIFPGRATLHLQPHWGRQNVADRPDIQICCSSCTLSPLRPCTHIQLEDTQGRYEHDRIADA